MTTNAFISYRRDDSAPWAGRIYDHLAQYVPKENLFIDVDNVRGGDVIADRIQESIVRSRLVIIVIGPQWLEAKSPDGKRRLDDPSDFVRLEIETAIRYNIKMIPLIIEGTKMPKASELPESLHKLALYAGYPLSHQFFPQTMKEVVPFLIEPEPQAPQKNPFSILWLVTGTVLNIAGLAHVAGDAIKWVGFFQNIWDVYRLLVREPIYHFLLVFWPGWFPPLPKVFVDWFVLWSGIWIAINVYHYQVSGSLKLASIFRETFTRVNDGIFFATRLPWLLIEFTAALWAGIVLGYNYVTLPIKYFYYAALRKSPLNQPFAVAERRCQVLDADILEVNHVIRVEDKPRNLLVVGVPIDEEEFKKDKLSYAQKIRRLLVAERRLLGKKLEQYYLYIAARRVMIYYASIVAIFVGILFINYTMGALEAPPMPTTK
jgi:hypothetical protein